MMSNGMGQTADRRAIDTQGEATGISVAARVADKSSQPVSFIRTLRARVNRSVRLLLGLATVLLLTKATAQCASNSGVFAWGMPNGQFPPEVLKNPNVDGVSPVVYWKDLEPGDGQFNWRHMDRLVASAEANGKKISLGVVPGFKSPDWIYAAGAASFSFLWDKPWGPPPCSTVRLPLPWDPVYMAKWQSFVRALGARYGRIPNVVMVRLTGVNAQTPELFMPRMHRGQAGGTGQMVGCTPNDDIAEWQSVGYRPSKVSNAWRQFAEAYLQSFPTQKFVTDVGPQGMPPIDENGNEVPGRAGRNGHGQVWPSIFAIGNQVLGDRYVVQNDGLSATYVWSDLRQLAAPASIGFQMDWQATNDPKCRDNGFQQPCDPATMLRKAVDLGITNGARYLEIYTADLVNPQLQDIVANAHRRLISSDP
jgi:hypothetical protein